MSAVTATTIGTIIAAGASAGAGIYAANKQSGAAENAAKTQSDAAIKTTQIQSDAANKAAELQSQSAKDALAFSRSQSQLALDQYNQQQGRLQPYRNLGNFALGQPMEGAPAPLRLAGLPGQAQGPAGPPNGAPAPASPAGGVPDGDYRTWFQNLTGGKPLDQNGLMALKPQLDAAGVKITPPNQAGGMSKIGLPDGTWVRVLDGDTNQANPTVWLPQPGTGGGASPGGPGGPVKLGFQGSQLAPRQISTNAPMLMPFRALGGQ